MRVGEEGIIKGRAPQIDVLRRWLPLLVAGVGAAVFLAAVLAVQFFSSASVQLPQDESTGPGRVTGIMIILVPLLAAWGVSIYLRCSDEVIRRCLLIIAGLLLGWFPLVLLKYTSQNDILTCACWYLYYLPMVGIPTLALLCGIRASALDARPFWKKAQVCIVFVSAVLVALVLSNSLHYQAFRFDFSNPAWSSDYSYGPVYWAVLAWIIFQLSTFFVLMFTAARRQARSALLPLIILGALGVLYCLLYILKVEAIFRSNLALTYALLSVVFMELSLDFGIFPSFTRYREAFNKLPFDVKVLDSHYELVFCTDNASPLVPEVVEALQVASIRPQAEEATSNSAATSPPHRFTLQNAPGLVFKSYAVPGAQVIITEDVSELHSLRMHLSAQQKTLIEQYELLKQQQSVLQHVHRLESERMLFEQLDLALSAALEQVSQIMKRLLLEQASMSSEEQMCELMRVKLLIAQCKRKGSLILAQSETAQLSSEELSLITSEVNSDIRSATISCAVAAHTDVPVARKPFTQLYDCLFTAALHVLTLQNPSLLAVLDRTEQGRLVLRMTLGGAKLNEVLVTSLAGLLQRTYTQQGILCNVHTSDELLNLTLVAGEA